MSRFDVAVSKRLHPAGRDVHKRLRHSEESLIDKAARQTRPARNFEAEVEHHLGLVVVRMKGELDISQLHRLDALLPLTAGPTPVRMDLSGLTFIDLSALRHLLHAKQQADRQGHTFLLIGASGGVRRLFDLMGVPDLLSDPGRLPCAC